MLETWKHSPKLLPKDPWERAQARFWASFIQQELFESLCRVTASEGEAQEEVAKAMIEKHKVFEAATKEFFKGNGPFTNGENLGLLDILTGAILGQYQAQEQVFGAKFLEPDETPFLFSWVSTVNDHPLVKEVSLPHDTLVGLLQFIKQSRPISSGE